MSGIQRQNMPSVQQPGCTGATSTDGEVPHFYRASVVKPIPVSLHASTLRPADQRVGISATMFFRGDTLKPFSTTSKFLLATRTIF